MSEQNIPKKRARRVGGSRVIFSLVVTLLFACVYFYIALPAINLHDPGFYFFFLLCSVIFCLLCIITGDYAKADGGAGAGLRAVWKNCKIPLVLCAGLALLMVIGGLAGSVIFRSRAYTQLLQVENGDFAQDVEEISFDQIPMLDSDSAAILGNRKLGELSDMVSQFEVSDDYYQINYRGAPVRVATLRYGDLFKWFSNMKNGLPAYVRINMVSQNVEIVRLNEGMRFSTGDHFSRNLSRKLRLDYPTWLFGEPNFEIDDEGRPYWICPRETRTIGLFGGTDVIGAVLLDAVTGESRYYETGSIPNWVDRVFSADLIMEQYDYYGQYQGGFFNSLFGQKGCTVTTAGYNYIAMNDDVYVYTGVTSTGGDESNIGFLLSNQRTKETRYYPCAGAEEYSARDSAEGVVQHLGYVSTFPLLLNVDGQPTYFMSLKDNAGLVKMYAMVNVQRYNLVATGASLSECQKAYTKLLSQEGIAASSGEKTVEGVLAEVRSAVIDGNSWYYFRLQGERTFYSVSAARCELAVVLDVGDQVRILGAAEEGDIRPAEEIERY